MKCPDQINVNYELTTPEVRELVDLLDGALTVTKFRTMRGEVVSPEQSQSAYSDADGRTSQVRDI